MTDVRPTPTMISPASNTSATLLQVPGARNPSRRGFLKSAAIGGLSLAVPGLFPRRGLAAGIADRYAGVESRKFLGDVRVVMEVNDTKVFLEGPAVDRAGNVFFTNVPVSKILKWDPATESGSVFREKTNETNGLLFDPDGHLLACEGGAGRITRTDMKTGRITVLAGKFNGFKLAPPNDLALDAKGRIYFTSRPGTADPKKGNVNAVYRIDPAGTVDQILAWPTVHMPNGIVTSPDDRILYVIEAHPDADRHRNILAYDLQPDGKVTNQRVLIDFDPGRSGDGLCIDAEGNLYVAAGLHKRRGTSETLDTRPGIHVISPEGELLAYRETPTDTITNCTFGGDDLRTLYITCGRHLLSLRTTTPGKPAYRPRA